MFIYYDIIRGFIFRYDKHKDTSATAYPDNICRSPIVPEQHISGRPICRLNATTPVSRSERVRLTF